jgi:hypothetical protein
VSDRSASPPGATLTKADREDLDRAFALARVDLRHHNAETRPPTLDQVVSQVVSADQCMHPDYEAWSDLIGIPKPVRRFNRKVWEWVYILQAARQHEMLQKGRRAVGFGVGNEPLPAVFARYDVEVVATDQSASDDERVKSGGWAETGQLLVGVEGLLRPEIVDDDRARELIKTRRVDMNDVPDDLAPCDLAWSACALEHLGSPQQGMRFVQRTAELLAPGGIAVHTTELELTDRARTVDHGHLACYRPADLRSLADELTASGFEIDLNLHVSMETAEDRWVSVVLLHGPDLEAGERAHLKLALNDSVLTSVGLIIRRPPALR